MYSERAHVFYEKLNSQMEGHLQAKERPPNGLRLLDDAGVPAGPVRFVEELVDDEQVTSNGISL